MNRIRKSVLLTFVLAGLAVVAGCSKAADDHAGHDHEPGESHTETK